MQPTSSANARVTSSRRYRLIGLLAAGLVACLLLLSRSSEILTLALAAIATAAFLGIALHQRRQPDADKRARELSHLLEISNAIHASLDYVAIVRTILSGLGGLVQFDRGIFYRTSEPASPSVIGTEGTLPADHGLEDANSPRDLIATSCSTGRVQTRRLGNAAEVAIPIFTRERVEGVLLLKRMSPREFSGDDLRLLNVVRGPLGSGLEKALLHEQVRQDAIRDSLTGLYNHGYLISRLEHELERSRRQRSAVSFLMAELDSFKKVNDVHGHLTGDAVVRELAQLFIKHSRKVDLVGRYGGDEFGIILPDTDLSRALIVAERFRQTIEGHPFVDANGQVIGPDKITITIGVATYPTSASGAQDLIAQADAAQYRGKSNGKNQVCTAPDLSVFPSSIPAAK